MPFDRDALAISLLLFSVIFTIWLIAGPPGVGGIQAWQTLMAAFVALGAAALAYKAAMVKVGFDRDIDDRNELRKKLGIYVRLDAALSMLELETFNLHVQGKENEIFFEQHVLRDVLALREPAGFSEAWLLVETLPTDMIISISTIKQQLLKLEEQSKKIERESGAIDTLVAMTAMEAVKIITIACTASRIQLRSPLKDMRVLLD